MMNKEEKFSEKLQKVPKYKIGDIVVYRNRYIEEGDGNLTHVFQGRIVEACGLIEKQNEADVLGWFYHTEETLSENQDSLEEIDIMYKL